MNLWNPIVKIADHFFGLVDFVGKAIDEIDWWFDDEPRAMGGKIDDSDNHVLIAMKWNEYIIPVSALDKHKSTVLDLE